ncbi:MAG: hypothetical protein ACLT64_11730 [Streptococcus salivarius]
MNLQVKLFSTESIIQNLLDNNPNAFIFAYQKEKNFPWSIARNFSSKRNDQLLSYALAGTFPKQWKNAGKIADRPQNL